MAHNQFTSRSQSQPYRGQYQGPPAQNGWPDGARQYSEGGLPQHVDHGNWGKMNQPGRPSGYQVSHAQSARREDAFSPAPGPDRPHQQQSDQNYHKHHGREGRIQRANGPSGPPRELSERSGMEKHRPPANATKAQSKSKSRERILPAAEPPIAIGWDNPFPVFNAKKKNAKKRSSLDKDMSSTSQSNQPEQRPNPSPDHNRDEPARPHTSQEHRRPGQQVTSPGPHSAHPLSPTSPTSPLTARPPEIQNRDRSRKDSTGRHVPARPPVHRLASDGPAVGGRDEAFAPLAKSQRSMTMPEEVGTDMTKKKLHKNHLRQINPDGSDRRARQQASHHMKSPIHDDPNDNTAAEHSRSTSRNALFSPEMPNFDAISPSANEKSEDPLNDPKPAYQKPSYADSVGFAPFYRGQPSEKIARRPEHQADFSGFVFDLPANDDGNPGRLTGQHVSQPSTGGQVSPTSRGPPQGQRSPSSEAHQQQTSRPTAEQYPSRSGSAHEYQQPRSAGNGAAYHGSTDQQQQRQYRDGGQSQRSPPVDQTYPVSRDGSYDYRRGEFDGAAQHHPDLPQEPRRFYPNPSQYPARINTRVDTFNEPQPGRGPAPHSAHPAPVRQYTPSNTASPVNPDALPAHPVPVRPGLLRRASAGSAPNSERRGMAQQAAPALYSGPMAAPVAEEKPAPVTTYELNQLLQTVKKNPDDRATTMRFVKKLVEAASVLSSEGGKADAKTVQKNRERYLSDAHKYLKKLVHKGYGDALFYLAECHGHGTLGLPIDAKEAFHLYTSAAKSGHAQAAYRVAVCCEMGQEEGGGTRRDASKAMHWYKRAASMGDTPAMYKLGVILLKGLLGQARNPREAVSWLKRAAEKADKDNPHALHELALLHETAAPSDAIVKDEAYALQLFTQAANLGYKYSQFRLGSAFEYGLSGCAIDARHSIAWYSKAAAQGEHQSELALSGWYLTGSEGILQQSDTEAYLWARKAASSGLAKAEYAMGYFTEVGMGCTANLDEAKKWYWRAASQNFPKARQRLEDLKKGGGKMQKTRVSRSAMSRHNEGDCRVM